MECVPTKILRRATLAQAEKYSNFCILITTTEKGRKQEKKEGGGDWGLDEGRRAA